MNRSPRRLEEVDGSPWRLEEVDGGDEQYPMESRFAVLHTPPVGDITTGRKPAYLGQFNFIGS